jgi:hypothetical protein
VIKFLIALAVQPVLALFTYVVFSAAIYIYEETIYFVKSFKRRLRQAKWDLQWKLHLIRKGVNQWITKS